MFSNERSDRDRSGTADRDRHHAPKKGVAVTTAGDSLSAAVMMDLACEKLASDPATDSRARFPAQRCPIAEGSVSAFPRVTMA